MNSPLDHMRTADPSETELGTMTAAAFVARLREACARPGHGMSNHPLVTGLEAGTITLPQLRLVVEQFYLHVRNMLPWIGQIFVTCPHESVRAVLAKNLAEECLGTFTNTKAHPELMLEFGAAIGLDIEKTRTAEQRKVGRRLTEFFEFMSHCRPWYVPLAAIGIGLESFVPDTFTRMIAALKKNYGMKDEQLVFWSMHIQADKEHGDEGIELVSSYALTPRARKQVYDATVETSERYYELWNIFASDKLSPA
jgi:pyrroloquinoline-quinone synthase